MLFIRSLAFLGFMVVCIVFFAIIILLSGLFMVPIRWRRRLPGDWGRANLLAAKWICGIDYRIEGIENMPTKASITFWKHQSMWETAAQMIIVPRRQCWVLKQSLISIPIVGWAINQYQPIAIDRSNGRRAVRQVVEQGKQRLADGLWVSIFPEGTRMAPGATRRYGTSGIVLAQETGRPIVPIAHNAGDFWPRHSFLKRPGVITLRIGKPIDVSDMAPKAAAATVQDWVESQMRDISDGYRDGDKSAINRR